MNPHAFTLRQLQYVVAVADLLNFSRAAEACAVSQPSLSAQLQQVEVALGVQLFERSHKRRVLLTHAGEVVVARARQLLADADALQNAARQARNPLEGVLTLGIIPTVAPYLLPAVSPALRRAFPKLELRWREDRTSTVMSLVQNGQLDGAVVALEAELGDVEHAVIATDPFVLVTAKKDPLGQGGAVERKELRDAPVLVLDDGHCLASQVAGFCSKVRASEQSFRATSLPTLTQLVAGGSGVTLLPTLALKTEVQRAQLSVRPFSSPAPFRTIALVWRPRSALANSLQSLANVLKAAWPP